MRLQDQRPLPASLEAAWAALNDEAVLAACIPGCESLTRDGPDRLVAVVVAAIGPVRARFTGKLTLSDVTPPEGYRLVFEGQGGAAGFSKGQARVRLEPRGAAETLLHYEAEVQVGGKLAQIGSRIVDAAAQKIVGEFFGRFEQQLAAVAAAAAPVPPRPALPAPPWWRRLWQWLRGLAGTPARGAAPGKSQP